MSDDLKQHDDNSKDESPLTTALESHLDKYPVEAQASLYKDNEIVILEPTEEDYEEAFRLTTIDGVGTLIVNFDCESDR